MTAAAQEADATQGHDEEFFLDIVVIEHPAQPVAQRRSDYLTCKTEESTCDGSNAC